MSSSFPIKHFYHGPDAGRAMVMWPPCWTRTNMSQSGQRRWMACSASVVELEKISKHYRVGHGSVPCRPLFLRLTALSDVLLVFTESAPRHDIFMQTSTFLFKPAPFCFRQVYAQEGRWECHCKYIEQNCFSYFLRIQWTNRCILAAITIWQSLKATTARIHLTVDCMLSKFILVQRLLLYWWFNNNYGFSTMLLKFTGRVIWKLA